MKWVIFLKMRGLPPYACDGVVKVTKQRVNAPISAHCGSSGAAIVTAYKSELFVITPLRRVQHCKVSCSHVSITEALVSNFLGRIQYGTSFAKVPSFYYILCSNV
jgi:hypothetical protein